MTIKAMTHKTTGERFLSVDEGLIPIGIAAMCVDRRISNFEIKCTECRTLYPVRNLNGGGYCEACVAADFEEAGENRNGFARLHTWQVWTDEIANNTK